MNKIWKISIVYLFVGQVSLMASSFTKDNIGTTGGQFLKLSKGVRAIGMGEAYCGISDDSDAVFWNPAGLNLVENLQFSAMHSMWFETIFFDYITFAKPLKNGVLGGSANYLGMDDIEKFYKTGERANESYSPYDLLLYMSYANKFKGHLLGSNVKFIQSVIDSDSAVAAGLDIGYMNKFWDDRLTVGSVVQNIGTKLKFRDRGDPLPFNIKMGVSYKNILKGLLLSGDINLPIDNVPSFHMGTEYRYGIKKVNLSLRTGFKTTTINDLDRIAGLSAGFGINFMNISLDYVWVPYGKLGTTHRFAFSYTFAGKKKELKKKVTSDKTTELKTKYFMQGHTFFKAGKYKKAIKEFKKVLNIDPHHSETLKYIKRAEEALIKGK